MISALALGAAALSADRQGAQTPVFRAGIDLVQVDVSALDRNRRPVLDLAEADFTVLENGRPQEIVAFAPVNLPSFDLPSAPWIRDVPSDVRTNELGDARLFAVVMDDAAMPPDLAMAKTAREIGRSVIDELGPADLASVIFTRDNRHAQDFTTDRARLRAAVDRFQPGVVYGMPGTSDLPDSYSFISSIRTLNRVIEYLGTVPQRRKTVIYVSTGVPVDVEEAASVVLIGPDVSVAEHDLARDLNEALRSMSKVQAGYALGMRDAFVRAQHGNVNVYSVDPGGLGGLQFFLQNRRSGLQPATSDLANLQRADLHRDYLRTVANNSGGRAIVDTNDLRGAIGDIFRENSSYYLLGYRSTRAPGDRKVRKVEVRVTRPGVTAHTRNAYYDPRARAAGLPADPSWRLANALSGILPSPDIALRAAVAPMAVAGRRDASVAVVLGVRQPIPPADAGDRVRETVELLARAFTPGGDARGAVRQTAHVVMRAGAAEHAQFDVLSRIDLPPGRYQLRLAAHSAALNKSGSVFYDVEVPDFTGAQLQLSGLVLAVTPGAIAAPADALTSLTPIVPTSRREFAKTDAVQAFLQIYAGRRAPRAPIGLTVRISDENNRIVYRTAEPLTIDRFDTARLARFLFDLPLQRLDAGRYLLTVEAELGGQSARRDVPFQVR